MRFGWKRAQIAVTKMAGMVRYMPDYYTATGLLVEVMGCGRDNLLKGLKADKWSALLEWNRVQPVHLWLWNSYRKEGLGVGIIAMSGLVVQSAKQFGRTVFESDGHEYYPIPWAWIREVGYAGQSAHVGVGETA